MQLLRHLKDNRAIRTAFLAVLALLAAVSVFQGARNALEFSQDLQWDAAKALAMGLDPYELSKSPEEAVNYPQLAEFYGMFTEKGLKQSMEANQFPSLLLLLYPVTLFSPAAARVVWLILNLLFTAGIIALAKKTFFEKAGNYEYAVIVLVMLAGTPFRNQLGVGQHTLFSFFFFMLAVYIDKMRPVGSDAANMLLTAFCLFVSFFKYTLTAPLALYFLYRKRYAALAVSAGLHVILTQVSAVWLGKSFIYMIKAPLEVASALAAEGGIDLGVLLGGKLSYAVAFVIAVALMLICIRMPEEKEYLLFPMLILWSLILTYHRTYDFFVLIFASMPFFSGISPSPEAVFGKKHALYAVWYVVLVIAVFFLLRLFGENNASKIATGVLYYAFTLVFTAVCILNLRKKVVSDGE